MQALASGMGYNLLCYTACLLASESRAPLLIPKHSANLPPPRNSQHVSSVFPFVYIFIQTHIQPPWHSSSFAKAGNCSYSLVGS